MSRQSIRWYFAQNCPITILTPAHMIPKDRALSHRDRGFASVFPCAVRHFLKSNARKSLLLKRNQARSIFPGLIEF